jgi:sugar phosphate isomerase/epimerase
MFKLSILFGDGPNMEPAKIAPGFEMFEIPTEVLVSSYLTHEEWERRKGELAGWGIGPIKVASHWLNKPCTTPNVDWELLEFWTKRALKRLSEIGVTSAGIYGLWFPRIEHYSATRQMDQAIRYANLMGDTARSLGMKIMLEPMADPNTLWPTYKEGLEFVERVDHPHVQIMADMNYFLKLDQPFEHIKLAPERCLHCHIAGDHGQPGVGDLEQTHKAFFRVLRDIDYQGGVSCACPWVATSPGDFNLRAETERTLCYVRRLREEVYNE